MRFAILAAATLAVIASVAAQETRYRHGSFIFPLYEGWFPHPDGSVDLYFGYQNRNYEEILNIPIGPNNSILPVGPGNTVLPGEPDRGQPTRFYPRRSQFTFSVRVPKEDVGKELVWTLSIRGRTEHAFANFKPDFVLDKQLIMRNLGGVGNRPGDIENEPPAVRIEGPTARTIRVGEPLRLAGVITDDGLPNPKYTYTQGLRAGWDVWRGAGLVAFDPPHMRAEPQRPMGLGASKINVVPDGPPLPIGTDGAVTVTATFEEPGTYILRLTGIDGSLATSRFLTVTVTP